MEKPLLLRKRMKLECSGPHIYLMSVFDLNPSGIIILARNQIDFREHSLSISESQVRAVMRTIRKSNILLSILQALYYQLMGPSSPLLKFILDSLLTRV